MSYLGTHRSNILEEIAVPSWRNIKRGHIITANYRSEKTKKVEWKMYLVLHPYWPRAEGKMHVLDLSYIQPTNLRGKLMRHTIQKQPLQETFRNKPFTRLDFRMDELNFYRSVVKALINDGFGKSYRTIVPQNLTKIRVINYEWYDSKPETKQGITEQEHLREMEAKQSKQTRHIPGNDLDSRNNPPGNRGEDLDK